VIEGDACDETNPSYPKPNSVDLITFSYSLTMIPDWFFTHYIHFKPFLKTTLICFFSFLYSIMKQNKFIQIIGKRLWRLLKDF